MREMWLSAGKGGTGDIEVGEPEVKAEKGDDENLTMHSGKVLLQEEMLVGGKQLCLPSEVPSILTGNSKR